MKPLQLAIKNASGKAKYTNGSYLENWYVQAAPAGSKAPVIIVGTPGTTLYETLPEGQPLAGKYVNDLLYVVTNTKFYSIDVMNVVTELGTVDIVGRAMIATNGTYLCITGENGNGYYYSVADGFNQFTGAAWLNYASVKFMDGYFIFSASLTNGDVYGISAVNQITLDATEISYAESNPDKVVAAETLNGEYWLFGAEVTEVHYNSQDINFPLERRQGVLVERGIAAAYSLVKDSTLYWLGDDRVMYAANGYQEARISDHDFEESIALGTVSDAHAYIYTEEGHKFLVITFPNLNLTWAFDLVTGLWARRSHLHFDGRHYGNCFFKAFDKNLIGDFQSGNIYHLTLEADSDNGDSIVRDMTLPTIHADRERATLSRLELRASVGTIKDDSDPKAQMRYSDDDQNNWSNWKKASLGKKGGYLTRIFWTRLGQFRERNITIRISGKIKKFVIAGAYGDFS